MTTLRLAWGGPPGALAKALAPQPNKRDEPALLVSYFYWKGFVRQRSRYGFRDYALDSGAFSAMNSGKTIDLVQYTEDAGELLRTDPQCVEAVALGVPVTPCFHVGSPWHELRALVQQYPKVNIGQIACLARQPAKLAEALDAVFAHTWQAAGGPYPLHGLGCLGERVLMQYPFDSVDGSSWELGPCCFGRWMSYGQQTRKTSGMSVRGGETFAPRWSGTCAWSVVLNTGGGRFLMKQGSGSNAGDKGV